jgi:hypothetical protein
MLFIFPLIYIVSFYIALKEIYKGKNDGVLTFIIFGISVYTIAMSVTFDLGLKTFIPYLQSFKELLIIIALGATIFSLKVRPRFHLVDYVILAFLFYLTLFAILPIGEQGLVNRLLALKGTAFFVLVYFIGRFINPKTVYVNKYFNYVVLLTIAAASVTLIEAVTHTPLPTISGLFEYSYYFLNLDADGEFGLSAMFNSDSGLMRYPSFFTSPLEHAGATLLALSIILGLYTRDDNKFTISNTSILALGATVISMILSFSRAPIVSYCIVIYVYALITKKRLIVNTIHIGFIIAGMYIIYLLVQFEKTNNDLLALVLNTIDFTDPSSVGHLAQWTEGVIAISQNPFGLGLGTSGRVASSSIGNTGGENQYIILAVQAGVIAAMLYLSIIIMFFKTSIKWLPRLKGKERKVCLAVLLIKIGLFLSSMTSEVESSIYLSYMNWFLSGLLISIITQASVTQTPIYNDHRENN